jgi:hypothetical protein
MKLQALVSGLVLLLPLTGCSEQTRPTSSTNKDMTLVPESSMTLECTTFSPDAQAFVRQQAHITVNGMQYRVATVGCGEINSELSAEVVESFVEEGGIWVSQGLVSGPDVPFNTSGPCESENVVVRCPAYFVTEDGKSTKKNYIEVSGYIEITAQDNGLVWTFVAEEEVAL